MVNLCDYKVGPKEKLTLFAGPCVIEDIDTCRVIAESIAETCSELGVQYVFKGSFDKANRTSVNSFRGPGMEKGLEILHTIGQEFNIPLVTDIHEPNQAKPVAEVVDVVQIPAFLCRQTDLLVAAGETGKVVNVKKAQFAAAEDMASVIGKVKSTGNDKILLTERGTSFGYHNFVVDMRSLVIMSELGVPVVFDGTHSVQLPGAGGTCSGGCREYVYPLVKAAVAVGVSALFLEVHPDPDKAKCDGPNSLDLDQVKQVLTHAVKIHELNK